MRIFVTALALCALSFFAGVAGDLSTAPANAGQSVTLRIPPPIPADAPRAHPLPALVRTSFVLAAPRAEAAEMPAAGESALRESRFVAKPLAASHVVVVLAKLDETALAKAKQRKFA